MIEMIPSWVFSVVGKFKYQDYPTVDFLWNPEERPDKIENRLYIYQRESKETTEVKWFAVNWDEEVREISKEADIMADDIYLVKVETDWREWKDPKSNWMLIKIWDLRQS